MVLGIGNFTNVTIENITKIGNVTEPAELYINVNNGIYGGWLIFFFLLGLAFLLFTVAQRRFDQPLVNLMFSFGFVSLVAIVGRSVFMTISGIETPLITDVQMWFFPIVTSIIGGINWIIKKT